jgi:probable HAF family extracellular repeat protein
LTAAASLATGHFTVPTGINDAGQIVGHYITASSNGANGFLYSNGVYTTIDDPPGTYSTSADGINNAGQVVDHYEVGFGGPVYMFTYSNGVYTTINDPVGTLPTPAAINDLGQIVGYHYDSGGSIQAFLATPTTPMTSTNIEAVSTAADGTLGNYGSSLTVIPITSEVFSPDGTEIVFESAATNLVNINREKKIFAASGKRYYCSFKTQSRIVKGIKNRRGAPRSRADQICKDGVRVKSIDLHGPAGGRGLR